MAIEGVNGMQADIQRQDVRDDTALSASASPQPSDGEASDGAQAQANAAADSSRPPNSDVELSYTVGERVSYWSDTHKQWMDAVVNKQNLHPHGAVMSYDLDVKRGAQASKMRRMISEAVSSNAASAGPTVRPPAPAQPEKDAPSAVRSTSAERFEVNQKVEYWSDTYSQWMQAVVQRVREDGQTYDLDVKRGAQRKRMRAQRGPGDAVAPTEPAPAGLPATALPATSAPVAALVSGQGRSDVPSVPVPDGLSRGPSPLSGRADRSAEAQGEDAWEEEASADSAASPAHPSAGPVVGAGDVFPRTQTQHVAAPALPEGYSQTITSNQLNDQAYPQAGAPAPKQRANSSVYVPPGLVPLGRQTKTNGQGGAHKTQATLPQAAQLVAQTSPAQSSTQPSTGTASGPPARSPLSAASNLPASLLQGARGASPTIPTTASASNSPAAVHVRPNVEGVRRDSASSPKSGGQQRPSGVRMPTLNARGSVAEAPAASTGLYPGPAQTERARMLELQVGEVTLGSGVFEPKEPALHTQLFQKLGVSPGAGSIERMEGFAGGLNEGVWILKTSGRGRPEDLVLKLVKCIRIAPSVPTEAENFIKLQKDYPAIMSDPSVAFPSHILSCMGAGGVKRHDLIVMRKVPGMRMAELIANKWYGNQIRHLMDIFEKLGLTLAEYHARYGNVQHGDFQPSNVFYDEEEDKLFLIDMGGMGMPTMETDVQHFSKSMKLLSDAYGPTLLSDGMRHFEQGYAKVKRR